jgi:hypothetical protein
MFLTSIVLDGVRRTFKTPLPIHAEVGESRGTEPRFFRPGEIPSDDEVRVLGHWHRLSVPALDVHDVVGETQEAAMQLLELEIVRRVPRDVLMSMLQ